MKTITAKEAKQQGYRLWSAWNAKETHLCAAKSPASVKKRYPGLYLHISEPETGKIYELID